MLRTETLPTSSSANPLCMKKTRHPPSISQRVSMASLRSSGSAAAILGALDLWLRCLLGALDLSEVAVRSRAAHLSQSLSQLNDAVRSHQSSKNDEISSVPAHRARTTLRLAVRVFEYYDGLSGSQRSCLLCENG